MTAPAISIRGIGKRYSLHRGPGYRTLRETLSGAASSVFGGSSGDDGRFWALKDLSFDVAAGETLGIVGRNGAGKSTLLKILSRITAPTEGRAEINGRVSSLLEVGTGFHPELTGRENIFLNGAILGMSRREVTRNLDAIVSFAEIEKFLDTAVKHYSSGMYVRLAFAVAAHLQTDIMIVDEVLAVGDAEFQKKCLGRMQSVSTAGRTVLFVSHNMAALGQLCRRGIVLKDGRAVLDAPIQEAVQSYLGSAASAADQGDFPEDARKAVQVRRIAPLTEAGAAAQEFDCRKPFMIAVDVQARDNCRAAVIVALNTAQGIRLLRTVSADHFQAYTELKAGERTRLAAVVPGGLLNEGVFSATAWVVPGSAGVFDWAEGGLFTLRDFEGMVSFIGERKTDTSALRLKIEWRRLT
jgi:lipopolysaccharide transport system ATP-binding protein